MSRRNAVMGFLRSREGQGWLITLAFSALVAVAAAATFYEVNLFSFLSSKTEEKATALQMVDAFVNNYSKLRGDLHLDTAPVPATFRAHSIELFNQMRGANKVLRVRWIGRKGRAIATPPADPEMAAMIESFVGKPVPLPAAEFLEIDGEQVFRTVYPSIAHEQSCIDCHNHLQPGQNWQLNDVMGAFSLDAPAGPFLRRLHIECGIIALAVFGLISGIGFWISVGRYRDIEEPETARAHVAAA